MKNVKTEVGSAITILNAIYADFGSAIGIDIPITVELREFDSFSITTYPENSHNLIKACLEVVGNESNIPMENIEISTYSPLPSQRGLKTSSAISCALIDALSNFYDLQYSIQDVILLASTASIRSGVSITGAYDDAYASYCGGMVITETQTKVPVHHIDINLPEQILLLIPESTLSKNDIDVSQYYMSDELQRTVINNIMDRNIYDAIKINTEFYAPKLLHNHHDISEISKFPCELIGLNGAGPSLFALCSNNDVNSFIHSMKNDFSQYQIMKTSLKRMYRVF